jgi:hypothetical protein
MLNQGRDVSTIPTYVKKKSTEISRGSKQNQEQRIVCERGHDSVSLLVLEYGSVERTLKRRTAEGLRLCDECRNPRGEVFIVEAGSGESFDQQTVFPQHENGIDSGSLAERCSEISDVGHLWVRGCEARNQKG